MEIVDCSVNCTARQWRNILFAAFFNPLTPMLPYGYSCKASCARPG